MKVNRLRQLLREKAGEEQLDFRIPEVFLPPRFRGLSEGRDLLLMLDDDLTIHIRWQKEGFHVHHPLTPGAARRLVRESLRNMEKYKKELKIFGEFVDEVGEEPFEDERYHDGYCYERKTVPPAKRDRSEDEGERTATIRNFPSLRALARMIREQDSTESGGESPCPNVKF